MRVCCMSGPPLPKSTTTTTARLGGLSGRPSRQDSACDKEAPAAPLRQAGPLSLRSVPVVVSCEFSQRPRGFVRERPSDFVGGREGRERRARADPPSARQAAHNTAPTRDDLHTHCTQPRDQRQGSESERGRERAAARGREGRPPRLLETRERRSREERERGTQTEREGRGQQ